MRPVLFHWRGRPVWSYPAFLYLGAVAGLVIGDLIANARGLDGTRVYLASVLLLPVALIGARLAFVAGHWSSFRGRTDLIWRRDRGGQVMYGGLVAVPLSVPLLAALDLPFWAFWDVGAFVMLTGMVFTRVGCLLNGCCVGRPTESRFGLVLRERGGSVARRIPTQLLEAALGGIVLGAVWNIPTESPAGNVFLTALAAYAVGRILLEGTRSQQGRTAMIGAIRAISLGLAATAVALLSLSASRL